MCWRQFNTGSCGKWSGYWIINNDIDNERDNPKLPLADWVYKGPISWCSDVSGGANLGYLAPRHWSHFCNPPLLECPTSEEPYVLDSSTGQTGKHTLNLYRGQVLAGKFIPKSPCIPYIMFHDVDNISGGVYTIEIRKDNGGSPIGIPGDENYVIKTEIQFDNNIYNNAIPVNAILESYDVPYWLVIYSTDFVCSNAYVGDSHIKAKLSHWTTLSREFPNEEFMNLAVYSAGSGGCGWTLNTTYGNICFSVYTAGTCIGCADIIDFGFAIDGISIEGDECFRPLENVKNKNIQIKVECKSTQNYKQARFDIAYKKPDGEYFTGSVVVDNIEEGINTLILDTGELYSTGIDLYYEELYVNVEIIQL